MKLRTKATTFWGSFLFVTALSIIFYAEYVVNDAFKKQTTNNLRIIAEQSESTYLAFLGSIKVRALDWTSDAKIVGLTKTILKTPDGSPEHTKSTKDFTAYLTESKMPFDKTVVLVDLLDRNGIVIASTQPTRIGNNEKAEEIEHKKVHDFEATINSEFGEVFFGTIVINGKDNPQPLMNATVRLFDIQKNGERIPLDAVLLIYLSNTTEIANILGSGESIYTGTLERAGRLTNKALLESYRTSNIYLVNSDRIMVTPMRSMKDMGLYEKSDTLPVRECLEHGREISEEYDNHKGVRVLGASMCFRNEGIVLIVEIEKNEILAPLYTLIRSIIVGGLIILIIGVLIVFFFVRRPLMNVNNMILAAKKVAQGDLSAQITISSKDEIGYLATVFNSMVTSIRDAQKKLQSSKQEIEIEKANLKKAQEIAHVGSWVLNVSTNQLTWSDEVYHIFEVRRGRPLDYDYFISKVHPDDRVRVNQEWGDALHGTPYDIEHRILVNNSIKWVRERADFEFDENHKLLHAIGTVQDVTKRKIIEEDLRMQREELARMNVNLQKETAKDEALLASIGEGILATNNEGNIMVMNRAAEQILGLSAVEMMGKKATEVIAVINEHGNTVSHEEHAVTVALKTSATITTSAMQYVNKKSGKQTPVTVTVNPVMLEGKLIGVIAIFHDITQEKELEEAQRDLLSLASHQLRTPLSGTKWLIETLMRGLHGPLTKEQKEYLDEIYKINERMTTLVQDMLSALRIESSTGPFEQKAVSIRSIFDAVETTMNPAAKAKSITLHVEPTDTEIILTTAPELLGNILESLVSNAITYSPSGKDISIDLKKEPRMITIAIRDSGIGIPKKEHGQIFKRFYRASNAKTYNTRGTGLGLHIASMLAKKIGVLLSFDSETGKGSTFYVHIPYPQEPLPEGATRV